MLTLHLGVCVACPARACAQLPSSSREEVQSTANKLGVTLALAFLLPQLLWGWDSLETAVLVGPLCAGWIVFDLSYMGAMMLIISGGEDDGSPPAP